MIVLDTETTGLVLDGVEDPARQPHIVDIAAVLLVDGKQIQKVQSFILPPVPLPDDLEKICGIKREELVGAPPFAAVVQPLIDLFRADPDNTMVAHNLQFDLNMLIFELQRIGWDRRFPYSATQRDTVTESGGKRLINWAKELFGDGVIQTHRAMDDVQLLIRCLTYQPKG